MPTRRVRRVRRVARVARVAALLSLALAPPAGAQRAAPVNDAGATAQSAVAALRRGEEFYGDVAPFVSGGALRPGVLDAFVRALRDSPRDARDHVARALVASALEVDPLRAQGGNALRDPAVIAALVDPGLSRADGAKEICLTALLENVPPALLRPHGAALLASLQAHQDPSVALAVARAKPEGALAAMRAIVARERVFRNGRESVIVLAALGDAAAEARLLQEFRAATAPREFRDRMAALALAQTPATLRALGEALRTPMRESIGRGERSMRLAVMQALARAFPDEPALYANRVRDDAGYLAAERFAETRLGVRFTAPRPPFFLEIAGPS